MTILSSGISSCHFTDLARTPQVWPPARLPTWPQAHFPPTPHTHLAVVLRTPYRPGVHLLRLQTAPCTCTCFLLLQPPPALALHLTCTCTCTWPLPLPLPLPASASFFQPIPNNQGLDSARPALPLVSLSLSLAILDSALYSIIPHPTSTAKNSNHPHSHRPTARDSSRCFERTGRTIAVPRDHEQSCFDILIKKQEKRPTALALLIYPATRHRRALISLPLPLTPTTTTTTTHKSALHNHIVSRAGRLVDDGRERKRKGKGRGGNRIAQDTTASPRRDLDLAARRTPVRTDKRKSLPKAPQPVDCQLRAPQLLPPSAYTRAPAQRNENNPQPCRQTHTTAGRNHHHKTQITSPATAPCHSRLRRRPSPRPTPS